MNFRLVLYAFAACLVWQSPAFAQYEPDTSLTYEDFLGQCMDFADAPREEVWVVNFWATWNRASLDILPQLKTARLRYLNKPVRFISISVDKNRRVWESQLDYFQLPWEHLFLPREADYAFLKRAFKHNSLPATFVVNGNANIRRVRDMNEFYMVMDVQIKGLPNTPYKGFDVLEEDSTATVSAQPQPPTPTPTTSTSTTPEGFEVQDGWVVHRVAKGETLYALFRKYGVKVELIKSRNGLSNNNIKVGQLLRIRPV